MADLTEGDTISLLGLLALILITLIPGLLIHSFITGINVTDWWKGRSVTSVDHIVTSLAISRMFAQCIMNLHLLVSTFVVRIPKTHVIWLIMCRVYGFFTFANIWLTSLLSIVFCLKISNLHTRLFLYLNRIIIHRTDHLIVACGFLSAFCSLMHSLMSQTVFDNSGTYNATMEHTMQPITDCIDVNIMHSLAIGTSIPLLFYYISSILLFFSLYHHTVKMKMSSNLSINLETYYSAMKFVSFTFIYNTVYFIGHFIFGFKHYFCWENSIWVYVPLDFLPVLHSSYLIYRTAKLRSQMSKFLQNVINFFFKIKDTEISENIEIIGQ